MACDDLFMCTLAALLMLVVVAVDRRAWLTAITWTT